MLGVAFDFILEICRLSYDVLLAVMRLASFYNALMLIETFQLFVGTIRSLSASI